MPEPTAVTDRDGTGAPGDERFAFGSNWRRFLSVLSEERIRESERALAAMLGVDSLAGRTFLDIGSGSGLSSLAAMRLGAERVHSLDYDADSVACTRELRRRYHADDPRWTVERGDATDPDYMRGLGEFDVVYSWGVLHHTGAMWKAMELAAERVRPGGQLFVALYNDQGWRSGMWSAIKRLYVRLTEPLRLALVVVVAAPIELKALLGALVRRRLGEYLRSWSETGGRGMSRWHDHVDWVGGWPFEVSKPEQVFDFYAHRGFSLQRMTTCGPDHGCNEFVFVRAT